MKTEILLILIFGCIFLSACDVDSRSDSASPATVTSIPEQTVSTPTPIEKSKVEEIKIFGEPIATLNGGDFVYPRISPDGKQIAYSKVLVEDTEYGKEENAEVHLYDFLSGKTVVLLDSKQAKKYAVYASFVADLEWIGAKRLRAYISDGDVDSTILTFNTQTRRLLKKEYSGEKDSDYRAYPPELEPIYFALLKNFPEISKDVALTAFNMNNVYKIGSKGIVLQFWHTNIDSNIWFFEFETKKKYLLLERDPLKNSDSGLKGAFETGGKIFFIHRKPDATEFFIFQNGEVSKITETSLGGEFQPLDTSGEKSIFLLKQPNYESEKQSSLWLFDGSRLNQITDVENLSDVNINASAKIIAFSFWANDDQRNISVRKLK